MRVIHVVGARPNFMKIAPIIREMSQFPAEFEQILIHTGQHYDANMSEIFFNELEMPKPDVNLEVGSGSHAWQTAQVMMRFEPILLDYKPDWILVPGDVNSTLACSLVASKLSYRIAHVEAGLRSFDRTMPEEINRLLTDQIADLLFTPSRDGTDNLLREGISPAKIVLVGNVMIDTLIRLMPKADVHWPRLSQQFNLREYVLVTLHRPSNVDDPHTLHEIMSALSDIALEIPVVFPVHPRTRQRIGDSDLPRTVENLKLIEPLGYLEFLALQSHARMVLTDSGGVQEETTYLGIPCLTMRPNTERPVTLTHGTNRLVASDYTSLVHTVRETLEGIFIDHAHRAIKRPELWDGHTAERIVSILREESI